MLIAFSAFQPDNVTFYMSSNIVRESITKTSNKTNYSTFLLEYFSTTVPLHSWIISLHLTQSVQ